MPEKLKDVALTEIPERAGLYVVETGRSTFSGKWLCWVRKVKPAVKNAKSGKWSDENKLHLAHLGSMRILNLKKEVNK